MVKVRAICHWEGCNVDITDLPNQRYCPKHSKIVKERKHPERLHTTWDEKFYMYKRGQIEHRSARHNKETNQFWKMIRECKTDEIPPLFGIIKQEMKELDKESPTYQKDINTKKIKMTICRDTYNLYKFIEGNKEFPTNIILEGIDGKQVSVTVNPPSMKKKDYTGFVGAYGYITTKGVQVGETGLYVRSRDKTRENVIKYLTHWHNLEDYPNPNLIKQKQIELNEKSTELLNKPDLKSNYWGWNYGKNKRKRKFSKEKR